jgi:hypothetical protein
MREQNLNVILQYTEQMILHPDQRQAKLPLPSPSDPESGCIFQ